MCQIVIKKARPSLVLFPASFSVLGSELALRAIISSPAPNCRHKRNPPSRTLTLFLSSSFVHDGSPVLDLVPEIEIINTDLQKVPVPSKLCRVLGEELRESRARGWTRPEAGSTHFLPQIIHPKGRYRLPLLHSSRGHLVMLGTKSMWMDLRRARASEC